MYRVIGGGPVGLWIASRLGECVVYEEHERIGEPEHCTGLVSARLGGMLPIPKEIELNKIKGAKFFSKSRSFTLSRGKVEASVIDRKGFDKHLLTLAEERGAKIITGESADPFSFPKSETVFVADGVASRTLPKLGQKLSTLPAVQYVLRTSENLDSDFVELHFLKSDFFAWVVPESNHVAKVGVATDKFPKELLETFLKKRFKSFIVTERQGSHVVVGGPLKRTVYGNIVLVGDAAGQVKATTGGGIVTGLISAEIAAKNAKDPSRYESEWRKKIGKELSTALAIRKVLSKLSDKEYDDLLVFAEKNAYSLKKKGDMDFHSGALLEIFSRPSNWPSLFKYAGKLF